MSKRMTKERTSGGNQNWGTDPCQLLEEAAHLVREAIQSGASQAEVYVKRSRTNEIRLGGVTDQMGQGEECGVALRIWDETGRLGHSTSTMEMLEGRTLIREALAGLHLARASGSSPEPSPPFRAPGAAMPSPPPPADPAVGDRDVEEKRAILLAALREVKKSGGEFQARYRDAEIQVALCNSRGFAGRYGKTLSVMSLDGGDGMGSGPRLEWVGTGPDPVAMTELARDFSKLQVEPAVVRVQPTTLFLRPAAASALLQLLTPHLIADPGAEGSGGGNPAAGMNQTLLRLASPEISVVDDGRLPDGPASAPFDGEGVPTGRLTLMNSGIRTDRFRKRRENDRDRPGTMQRASYQDRPAPAGTNLLILPGPRSGCSILKQVDEGYELVLLRPSPGGSESSEERWWQGIGWEIREGLRHGSCRHLAFRSSSRRLMEGVLEVADRPQFYSWRGFFTGSPDLRLQMAD